MRPRLLLAPALAVVLAAPAFHASAEPMPEGCVATNPGPASGQQVFDDVCEFTATRLGYIGGSGTWKVTVTTPPPPPKKGKKPGKPTVKEYKGNSPVPSATEGLYKVGDKLKVEALAPGSVAAAGDPQPKER